MTIFQNDVCTNVSEYVKVCLSVPTPHIPIVTNRDKATNLLESHRSHSVVCIIPWNRIISGRIISVVGTGCCAFNLATDPIGLHSSCIIWN